MIEPTNKIIDVFMREEARQADLGASTRHATRRAIAAVLAIVERDYEVRPREPEQCLCGADLGHPWDSVPHRRGTRGCRGHVTPPGDIVQQPLTSGPPAEPDHGRLPDDATPSWCHCVEAGYPGPHRRSDGCEGG